MINLKLFTEILTDTKQKLDNVFGRPITVADAVNRRLFWHPDVISAFQNAVNANLSCHENVMIFIKIHPAEVHSAILADDRNKDNLFLYLWGLLSCGFGCHLPFCGCIQMCEFYFGKIKFAFYADIVIDALPLSGKRIKINGYCQDNRWLLDNFQLLNLKQKLKLEKFLHHLEKPEIEDTVLLRLCRKNLVGKLILPYTLLLLVLVILCRIFFITHSAGGIILSMFAIVFALCIPLKWIIKK